MSLPEVVLQTKLTPPRVSLIAAAIAVETVDERWVNGILYSPEGCGDADIFDVCDTDPDTGFEKSINASAPQVTGTPVGIVASDTCSTRGFEVRDFQARATRMLLAMESFKLARELWEGTSGLNVAFKDAGVATSVGTNVDPLDVIGTLETAFFASSPAVRPMIHMSPKFLERLMGATGGAGLRQVGDVYYTWMDTVVAVDKGYRGVGPSDVAGEWVYITPIVSIRRSPIGVVPNNMSEAVLRRENQVTFFAERAVHATWDYNCQIYALSVDLT